MTSHAEEHTMPQLILHHYASSPFSEKVRLALGFKKLILPESNKKGLEKLLGMRVVGVKNLEQAMDELF